MRVVYCATRFFSIKQVCSKIAVVSHNLENQETSEEEVSWQNRKEGPSTRPSFSISASGGLGSGQDDRIHCNDESLFILEFPMVTRRKLLGTAAAMLLPGVRRGLSQSVPPKTLDLRLPMRAAAECVTHRMDPSRNYRPWFAVDVENGRPVRLAHNQWDLGDTSARFLEAFVMEVLCWRWKDMP